MRCSSTLIAVLLLVLPATATGSKNVRADGASFLVSDAPIGSQIWPVAAVAGADRALVMWHGRRVSTDLRIVVSGRFVGRDGPQGPSFAVSEDAPAFPAVFPSLAGDAERGWAVAWNDPGSNDGDSLGVFGRRMAGDGSLQPEHPFLVPETTREIQNYPKLAMAADGSFVVVWEDIDLDWNASLRARLFDADGEAASEEWTIRSGEIRGHSFNADVVAALPGGRFVFVDAYLAQTIVLRYIEPNGTSSFLVELDTSPFDYVSPAAVASCSDGRHAALVVVGFPGESALVWLDGDGNQTTALTLVGGGDYNARHGLVMTPECDAVVSLGDQSRIYAPDGTPRSEPFPSGGSSLAPHYGRSLWGDLRVTSSTRMLNAFEVYDLPTDVDIHAQWLCVMSDDDSPCGNATCAGDDDAESVAERVKVADAIYALRAAVGMVECALCRCDVDGSGAVSVSDSLRVLTRSVGLDIEFSCPACA